MSATTPSLAPTSGRRRATDRFARGVLLVLTLIALVPLVLIVYELLLKGLGALSWDFFTTDPTGRTCFPGQTTCTIGGVKSAILGTIEIVALAALIAIPFGIGVALYLVEFGKASKFANVVRYFVDVMTGVPSVVFGLFVYIVLVVTKVGGTFAAWKGSIALALLMLPVVTRSGEVVLNLVPNQLRESALALGAPRWKVVFGIVVPTALARAHHGLDARGGQGGGRDRAAALHVVLAPRDVVRLERPDELAADPDLQRRPGTE